MKKSYFITLLLSVAVHPLFSQNLMDLLDEETKTTEYTTATFKTTRVVNGHSVEAPAKGELVFIISHDFGRINQGAYEFFGLDQGTIRLGFEYSLTDWLNIGIGRSSYLKTYDGFLKIKLLRQSTGQRNMPVTLSYFVSTALTSLKWQYPDRENYFTSRLAYTHQLLIARKFNNNFSFQLSPTVVHRNLVEKTTDKNDVFVVGAGGRYKLTKRTSLNAEYWYVLPNQLPEGYYNSIGLGFDIETGGHVFQIHISNSQGMYERAFLTDTKGNFFKGDIYFGFNITRTF